MSRAADIRKALEARDRIKAWECQSCGVMLADDDRGPNCFRCEQAYVDVSDAPVWAWIDDELHDLRHGTVQGI